MYVLISVRHHGSDNLAVGPRLEIRACPYTGYMYYGLSNQVWGCGQVPSNHGTTEVAEHTGQAEVKINVASFQFSLSNRRRVRMRITIVVQGMGVARLCLYRAIFSLVPRPKSPRGDPGKV